MLSLISVYCIIDCGKTSNTEAIDIQTQLNQVSADMQEVKQGRAWRDLSETDQLLYIELLREENRLSEQLMKSKAAQGSRYCTHW